MSDQQNLTIKDAEFTLDLRGERLWKGDQRISITNKAFQLLKLFAERPERLVSKEEILDSLWHDVYVTEGLVREYVHDLRAVLEDDPKRPRFIETVPRRGYRFLGGVAIRDGTAPQAISGSLEDGRPIVEVRPFEDLTGTVRSARLANGLTDDLVTDLARFPDLAVVKASGETSATTGPNRHWESDYRLEGSVQISDGTVRVNVRLIKVDAIRHIWNERYDRTLENLLSVQSDLTTQIVSMIGSHSGPLSHWERLRLRRRAPSDLEAYELYRLAYDMELRFDRDSVLHARGLIERAIEIDPDFARGWLVLGWIYWQLATEKWESDPETYRRKMCSAYRRAATLDPRDQIAVMELSAARAVEGDSAGARDALERSLDLGGHHADTLISCSNYVASILDEPLRAVEILDAALAMLPELSAFHYLTVLRVAFFAGDYKRASEAGALSPDLLQTRVFRALAFSELGAEEEARSAARAVLDRTPGFRSVEYLSDHPITGAAAAEQFIAACDKLGLPRG